MYGTYVIKRIKKTSTLMWIPSGERRHSWMNRLSTLEGRRTAIHLLPDELNIKLNWCHFRFDFHLSYSSYLQRMSHTFWGTRDGCCPEIEAAGGVPAPMRGWGPGGSIPGIGPPGPIGAGLGPAPPATPECKSKSMP